MTVAGCGGGGSSPTNTPTPGPPFPNVRGAYFGQLFISEVVTARTTCSGTLTINTQTQDRFSGSFIQQSCQTNFGGPAPPVSGNVIDGIVRPDSGVTFNLNVPGSVPTLPPGCKVTGGQALLNGAVIGNTLQASRTTQYDCGPVVGSFMGILRIQGTRP